MRYYFDQFIELIGLYIRPTRGKTGSKLIGFGILLLTSGGICKRFDLETSEMSLAITFDTSISSVLMGLGIFLILCGLLMIFYTPATHRKSFGIIQLGMDCHMGTEKFLQAASKQVKLDKQDAIVIDQRPYQKSGHVFDPQKALDELLKLPTHLEQKKEKFSDMVYGGFAPVPFLFAAGTLLSNKNSVVAYDWDRTSEEWHALKAPSKKLTLTFDKHEIDEGIDPAEIAIAVQATFKISPEEIRKKTGSNTIFLGKICNNTGERFDFKPDLLAAKLDQEICAKEFEQFLNSLHAKYNSLKKIHIFIAAQASFCFLLGRQVVPKNHGNVIVYQFEKGGESVYPWGVSISSTGSYEIA